MPTFVLKKYQDNQTEQENELSEEQPKEKVVDKEMMVEVSGSVAEIVANALNKVFANKNVEVEETESSDKVDAEAISTEDIERDPVNALRVARSTNILLVASEGFKSKKDEYFLANMEDYQGKVFYSVESFIEHIVSEMCDDVNS